MYEGGGLYLDTKGTVNLGTGTIIVRNNTSEKTTGHNLYLPGAKKLIAPAGPADGSRITLSLPPVSYTHLDVYKRQRLRGFYEAVADLI